VGWERRKEKEDKGKAGDAPRFTFMAIQNTRARNQSLVENLQLLFSPNSFQRTTSLLASSSNKI